MKHLIKYEMGCTPVSAHFHVHGEDRSNCIPDWGTAAIATETRRAETTGSVEDEGAASPKQGEQ